MAKIAKLASRLNWRHQPTPVDVRTHPGALACFYLFTDQDRLADPSELLHRLPAGAAVVLRHRDPQQLETLARRVVPCAHALGLKVLLAGDVRSALRLGCDGVHLSQRAARVGPARGRRLKPGFMVSAAAHDAFSLRRAALAGADVVVLSPVFVTLSHADAKPLGVVRFARLCAVSRVPVVALGGITPSGAKRLSLGPAHGIAAIGAWRD